MSLRAKVRNLQVVVGDLDKAFKSSEIEKEREVQILQEQEQLHVEQSNRLENNTSLRDNLLSRLMRAENVSCEQRERNFC